MTYQFQSEETALLNRLKKSAAVKIKHGYNRDISAGFVSDDLEAIYQDISGDIIIVTQSFRQRMPIRGLNLRETEEAMKFVELKIAQDRVQDLKDKSEE